MKKYGRWLVLLLVLVILFGVALATYQPIKIESDEWPGNESGFSVGVDQCYFGVQYGIYHQIAHAEWFGYCGGEK